MDKSSIVNKFLEEDFLISPSLLDQLTEEKVISIIPTLKTKNTLVLSKLDDEEILKENPEIPITQLKPVEAETIFTIKKFEPPKSFSIKDFVQYYNTKYTILKNILCTKLNPVSINKITPSTPNATVIAMISEKTTGGYIVEDPTSRIQIVYEKPLQKNSVLGFTGELKENKLYVTAVSYPDIPLDKKIRQPDFSLSFLLEKNIPSIKINNSKEIKDFKSPTTISIKKNQNINILTFKPDTEIKRTEAIEFLKLRNLPEPTTPNENYIISEEPDIFWLIQKEPWQENYKGVKIISGEYRETE